MTLTINAYQPIGSLNYSGLEILNFDINGETKKITLDSYPHVTVNGVVIPLLKVALSNNYSGNVTLASSTSDNVIINNDGTISVSFNDNSGTNSVVRNTSLTITSIVDPTDVLIINMKQEGNNRFSHQKGHSGRALMNNGMQGVHTERLVVYMPQSLTLSRELKLPENYFFYSRWYQYDTDAAVSNGILTVNNSSYVDLIGNAGKVHIQKDAISSGDNKYIHAWNATYKLKDLKTSTGVITEVACDLSYYNDYLPSNGVSLTQEPTLSQRVIFEIRPAAEMASKLSKCTGDEFLEEYQMVAPINKVVRFGPQDRKSTRTNSRHIQNTRLPYSP